jgi:hypothetical protein
MNMNIILLYHCGSAITSNMPNQKRTLQSKDLQFVFKCVPPGSTQSKFSKSYATESTLRCGTIFVYCGWTWRNSHKTHSWPMKKIIKNHLQPWTWSERELNSSNSLLPQSPKHILLHSTKLRQYASTAELQELIFRLKLCSSLLGVE